MHIILTETHTITSYLIILDNGMTCMIRIISFKDTHTMIQYWHYFIAKQMEVGQPTPFITRFFIHTENIHCVLFSLLKYGYIMYICTFVVVIVLSWHTKDSKKNPCFVCMFKGGNDCNEEALSYSKYSSDPKKLNMLIH